MDTPAFDGVTYDKTKYTVTVTLEDDGQGHLTPKAEISGGEDGSIVLKNELARRDLTISKTTAGQRGFERRRVYRENRTQPQ